MPTFDYLAESALTASDSFHSDNVDPVVLDKVLRDCISSLQALDMLKKAFFYGKDYTIPARYENTEAEPLGIEYPDIDVVHGIIGVATEAGELLEALYATLFDGKEFDVVNAVEECSDTNWYIAMLLRRAGMTFDQMNRMNIAKLRKRFGEKFTEYDAKNRDLDSERVILEGGVSLAQWRASDDVTVIEGGKIPEGTVLRNRF